MHDPRPLYRTSIDPWGACHWGITDHPHYHDCENCYYGKACDIGAVILEGFELEAQRKETQRIVDEINAFCNTDYEIEACISAGLDAQKVLDEGGYDF